MPRLYLNEKEATALVAVIEIFIRENPSTKTTSAVAQLPERITNCINLQRVERKRKKPSVKTNG